MRFSVPQFIDVEDKVFGPLTFSQGVYTAGGVTALYVSYKLLGVVGVFLIGIPLFLFAIALAFVKIHQRPFITIVSAFFLFLFKDKLYLWKKTPQKKRIIEPKKIEVNKENTTGTKEVTHSKLRALAFALDTKKSFNEKNAH